MKRIAAYLMAGLLLAGCISGCKDEELVLPKSGAFLVRLKPLFQIAEAGMIRLEQQKTADIPEAENKSLIYTGVLGIHLGWTIEELPAEVQDTLEHIETDQVVTVLWRENGYIRNIYANEDIYLETIRENPDSAGYHEDEIADTDYIRKIVLLSEKYSTLGGISIGDSIQDVRDAYTSFDDPGPDAVYRAGFQNYMEIQIEGGKVAGILFDDYNTGSIM